jgi:hypothetical protein
MLEGAKCSDPTALDIYEDPRLREVEHGFHGTKEDVEAKSICAKRMDTFTTGIKVEKALQIAMTE